MREPLSFLLKSFGFRTRAFESAKAFLESGALDEQGCLIADIRMPDMDGLELQAELGRRGIGLPAVMCRP